MYRTSAIDKWRGPALRRSQYSGRRIASEHLGGTCMVSTTLDDDDRIVQLNDTQTLVYGERDGERTPRIAAIDATMQGADFTARVSTDIVREMWQKWVMLAALGGITCSLRGTIGDVAAARYGKTYAIDFLAECAAVAAAEGFDLDPGYLAGTRAMLTADGSPLASSIYRDLQGGRAVEAEPVLGDLIARAETHRVETPLLRAAFANLDIYRRKRDGTTDAAR